MEGAEDGSIAVSGKTRITRRIHILGVGNIGGFVAHSLASLPNRPPMTLLLHKIEHYSAWKKHERRITLVKHGVAEPRNGFDINVLRDGAWYEPFVPDEAIEEQAGSLPPRSKPEDQFINVDDEKIDSLILAVKATQVEQALKSVRHRLSPKSAIVFLQNGMGVQDEVNQKIFPDPASRPSYIQGVTTHGLHYTKAYHITHAGVGTSAFSIVYPERPQSPPEDTGKPRAESNDRDFWDISSIYLTNTLLRSPELTPVRITKIEMLQHQLEKLAINCVINPLTALNDCLNGDLLYNYNISRVQRLLLIEISTVIRALPELQGVPGAMSRFSPERLRTLAVGVMYKTATNTSSMLQDIRLGKETEIDYINGYIVRRGEELGIKCALNYMLAQMVLAKARMLSKQIQDEIPLSSSPAKYESIM
ncbi:2-dehydropantoate 2-reductase (Ketopantoate reductase) (KPA reductase) (KPR) [Ophidiomyces ophidiicola]|uniref:2-dehydropantoate 2-reductase (Ketopantoate reductase) (KPA reductase) (KPR) n=2 Tax=Ophidiomyces ophidiicola TaxID=1387563 RepID=A0ACB8V210_9EURO|nr:2-dehydropantoate 2-reductase (Ketopantoate reductase) (KPA reductase) (KPR) [Ophidiomyces ophidiicola]KAI1950080.1 2-dehydropantoate 2-reductase (Ketopantoate reductase) (KPA reductase) (KPR) [Ophidiomyces ophidiicola]KAI1959477.1 2-dehydropantoate 2-reductase (Ketopantoate reductase) (KPA reductase) (KPR) [Ophidiomyces ophidiicola]KAI1973817.1 2-dehydropantoate 2-reductase (Ketopantoate reductase) (KPA reductase) (KPR) [Ophidiomyces ophidiicola]KAI1981077.1 2-dehydropantoate 2-reductase (K